MVEYTVTQREPGTNPALTHKTHKCYLLLDPPIDLRQEMMMAAPKIVLIVYGMANPIRFKPRIRIAPTIAPITIAKVKIPMMDPARRALLPFVFPNNFVIASMLYCLMKYTVSVVCCFYLLPPCVIFSPESPPAGVNCNCRPVILVLVSSHHAFASKLPLLHDTGVSQCMSLYSSNLFLAASRNKHSAVSFKSWIISSIPRSVYAHFQFGMNIDL